MRNIKTKIVAGISVLFMACSNSETSGDKANEDSTAVATSIDNKPTMSNEEMNNIIQSMPSPVEFSSLIESTGARYDETFLNSTENSSRYNSQYSKSINLGIYGADLGYINMYEKTFSAIDYLNTVYKLSSDLNVGDYFDFETLKRLATNNKNLDSIVYITTKNFEKMHNELQKSGNTETSVLILIGGWVEGLHLTSSIISANTQSPEINNKLMLTIYDEHIILDDIITLAAACNNNPNFQKLNDDLQKVKNAFDQVKGQNIQDKITSEQFKVISKEIAYLRGELIK